MYAIVELGGKQVKVEKDKFVYTNRIDKEVGASFDINEVLLVDNNGKVQIGAPVVNGASVTAKVLEHKKDDKIRVFKFKRRKDYRRTQGHRQQLTKLLIEKINA